MNKINSSARYVIYAQNRDNSLIIQDVKQNSYMSVTANHIISNPHLAKRFAKSDLKVIHEIIKEEGEG